MTPAHGRIIDAWMQHPTPRLRAEPIFESLRRWVPSTTLVRSENVPVAATIAAMDAAGVRLGLICAWWGPRGPLIDNDEVAAFVREYPDRLVGVASVDLSRPLAAVRELRRAVRELGFRALRILPWLWNLPPDDRRYYPLYSECVELDIPFCLSRRDTNELVIAIVGFFYATAHTQPSVRDYPLGNPPFSTLALNLRRFCPLCFCGGKRQERRRL